MKKIFITTTLLLCMLISACGYHVAGFTTGKIMKYYIEPIINKTANTAYGNTAQNFIDRYFIKYGELTSEDKAEYYLQIALENIRITSDIVSATDEATVSNMEMTLQMILTDKMGKEVFSKTYKSTAAFGISSNISGSLSSRNSALTSAIDTILILFRNDINAKFL